MQQQQQQQQQQSTSTQLQQLQTTGTTDALPVTSVSTIGIERRLQELETKLEQQQEENSILREEAIAAKVQAAVQAATHQPAVSHQQLTALQARLEELHVAKLLGDDELYALEDLCADFAELQAKVGLVTNETLLVFELAAKVHALIGVSERIPGEAAFSRQLRRKFVPR
jgi:hypothetical protein